MYALMPIFYLQSQPLTDKLFDGQCQTFFSRFIKNRTIINKRRHFCDKTQRFSFSKKVIDKGGGGMLYCARHCKLAYRLCLHQGGIYSQPHTATKAFEDASISLKTLTAILPSTSLPFTQREALPEVLENNHEKICNARFATSCVNERL